MMLTSEIECLNGISGILFVSFALILSAGDVSAASINDFLCPSGTTALPLSQMSIASATDGWLNPPEDDAERLINGEWDTWASGFGSPVSAVIDLGGTVNVAQVQVFTASAVSGAIQVQALGSGVLIQPISLTQDYEWLGTDVLSASTDQIEVTRDGQNENIIELRVCLSETVVTPSPTPQPTPAPTTPNPTPQAPVSNPTNPPCTGGGAPSGTNPSDFACGGCLTLLPVESMTVSSASGGWLNPPENDAARLIDSEWGGWAPGYGNPATATFDLGGVQNVQGVYLFAGGNVAGDIGVSIPGAVSESIALNQEYTWLGVTFDGVQTDSITLSRDQSNENAIELRVCLGSDGPAPTTPPPTTPPPTPSPTTDNGGGPVTDDMPVTDTNGNLVTGQAYANANSLVELSSGFGTWSTKVGVANTLTQACIDMHDSYWVEFEGKIYHTWHPVWAIHPDTGEGCVWGHEHGNNPFESPLFEYAGGWPAFGSLMEMFNNNELQGGDDERLEDHVGHKVTVATYRATIGNPPNSGEALFDAGFFCHFLSKIHQGTYSNDALTNQLHEYFIAAQCDDNPVGLADRINSNMSVKDRFANPNNINTQFALKSMLPFGAPDQILPTCDTLLEYSVNMETELDSPPPLGASVTPDIEVDSQDGRLNHRGLGCINKNAGKFEHGLPGTIDQLDLWTQPRNIKTPDFQGSTGSSVSFQVYYNVKDVIRMYDKDTGTIRYTVDICNDLLDEFGGSFRFCEGVTPNMDWFDPDSPFKGALRSIHFKTFAVWDNYADRTEAFCTNSFGRQPEETDANGNCADGYVLQKIKPFQGKNNWFDFTNPVTGKSGQIVGALYVVEQNMEYPLQTAYQQPYQLVSGSAQSGLMKPFDTSTWPTEMFSLSEPRNCPLAHVSVSPNEQQYAFCTGGIGFEKLVDNRNAVPPEVAVAVAEGMNKAVHGPN